MKMWREVGRKAAAKGVFSRRQVKCFERTVVGGAVSGLMRALLRRGGYCE